MSAGRGKVLLAGETWVTYGIHQKGSAAYTTGGYAEGQREFVAALTVSGWEVDHVPNHLATERMPWRAEEFGAYDVVILSDIGADTLLLHPDAFERGQRTPNRLEEIADFVAAGGALLMVGGYLSFSGFDGKAGYHGTAAERCLPVGMLGYDDRAETPQGLVPVPVLPEHPVLAGLPDGAWPWFLGYNRLRPEGEVVLEFEGGDPLLVLGEWGAGRTAAFASDCSPHWGSPAFLEWPGYARFWDNLLVSLAAAGR